MRRHHRAPAPQIFNPNLQILNPQSSILNPKPLILSPKPQAPKTRQWSSRSASCSRTGACRHPTPHTLHPTSYNLPPTPYSLHSAVTPPESKNRLPTVKSLCKAVVFKRRNRFHTRSGNCAPLSALWRDRPATPRHFVPQSNHLVPQSKPDFFSRDRAGSTSIVHECKDLSRFFPSRDRTGSTSIVHEWKDLSWFGCREVSFCKVDRRRPRHQLLPEVWVVVVHLQVVSPS